MQIISIEVTSKEIRKQWGKNIVAARERRAIQQCDLAKKLKIEPSNLCGIEKGERMASLEFYLDIIFVLQCHPNEIFCIE